MNKRILLLGVGGPASENVLKSLKIADKKIYVVGCDCDEYMIQLSSADKKYIIPSAQNVEEYIISLNKIIENEKISMVYSQSDLEVLICSANRERLRAPVCLPSHKTIETCQDKGLLYEYLQRKNIPVPPFKNPTKEDIRRLLFDDSPNYGVWANWYPCWIRARHGAGGNKGFVARDVRDFVCMARFWKDREEIDWQLVQLLEGRDYSWTSIWQNGRLLTSVLKERLKWVYNRIGTTAVQRTVHYEQMNRCCKEIVRALESDITGIMMIDLKAESYNVLSDVCVTEVNAGRLGTVNMNYAMASRKIYGDDRVNFPYILYCIHHNLPLPKYMKEFDALPENLYYIRHLDMKPKLVFLNGK